MTLRQREIENWKKFQSEQAIRKTNTPKKKNRYSTPCGCEDYPCCGCERW